MGQKLYIADVLKESCNALKVVCKDVVPSKRPTASNDDLKEFIVVSFNGRWVYNKAYQQTNMTIEVFVRNKSKGVENTSRLQSLCNTIFEMFPIVRERFELLSPNILLRGDDGLGFSVWNIQCECIVNTTDNYK